MLCTKQENAFLQEWILIKEYMWNTVWLSAGGGEWECGMKIKEKK